MSAAQRGGREQIAIQLRPLQRLLSEQGVREVCVNKPGEAWVEGARGWQRIEDAELTYEPVIFARAGIMLSSMRFHDDTPTLIARSISI